MEMATKIFLDGRDLVALGFEAVNEDPVVRVVRREGRVWRKSYWNPKSMSHGNGSPAQMQTRCRLCL
jgi:hypothetical protein